MLPAVQLLSKGFCFVAEAPAALLFRTGRANYLEVLFAQQNALEVKLELIDARKRQLLTTVNLYKAVGGGWR